MTNKKQTKQTVTNITVPVVPKLSDYTTKSSYIRHLSSIGMTRSEIVKHFENVDGIKIRYQHVRNVLTQPLKRIVTE